MKALVTGASSGIGKEMAKYLASMGYDLIVVARSKERLNELKREITTEVTIYDYDLSDIKNCYKLCEQVKNERIDVIINNAGYGLLGDYKDTDLLTELNMIDLNVKCLHILTKTFVNRDDVKYILNVASSAGLTKGGPLMSTYYATKSYVCSYSMAIYEEIKRNKEKKSISILCPGPVDTNFNLRANVKYKFKSLLPDYVAKYGIDNMFKKKLIIIPGINVKLGMFFIRFLPTKLLLNITYKIQKRKKTP